MTQPTDLETTIQSVQDDVAELQSRALFQEDVIQKLDDVVVRQADYIQSLQRKLAELEERLEDLRYSSNGPSDLANEKPPHY
ncbi:SlyX family protein [Aurantivibrio plasticivorans]